MATGSGIMSKKIDTEALVTGLKAVLAAVGEEELSVDDETDLRASISELNGSVVGEADQELIRKRVLRKLDPRKVDN